MNKLFDITNNQIQQIHVLPNLAATMGIWTMAVAYGTTNIERERARERESERAREKTRQRVCLLVRFGGQSERQERQPGRQRDRENGERKREGACARVSESDREREGCVRK